MMQSFRQRSTQAWTQLATREQRMVVGGALLLLVAALWLLFDGLWQTRQTLLAERDTLRNELVWLAEQAELLSAMDSPCTNYRPLETSAEDALQRLAQRAGLTVDRQQQQAQGWRLSLSGAQGNAFLLLARDVACQGLRVSRLSVASAENGASFTGVLEVNDAPQ